MSFVRHLFTCAALLVVASCGGAADGGGTAPPPVDNTPASINLSPAGPITLQSGLTTTITQTVLAKDGHVVNGAGVFWSSSDPSIAGVNGGTVTGLKAGTTSIIATLGTVTASVSVTVTSGAAVQLVIRTQPAGGTIGGALGTQPVVEIRDGAGNLVSTSVAQVSVAIASGGGFLTGATSVTAVGGVATFTGLVISGAAGDRTLLFTSQGLSSSTSATVTMAPPPVPVLVLETNTATFNVVRNAAPVSSAIQISNGGSVAITALTVGAPVYDAGQPTGWLTPVLATATVPTALTLTATAGALPSGTYHAVVQLTAPGATNSPANISVTLNVITVAVVNYGTPAEKVRVVDINGTFTPTVSVTDASGAPLANATVTFASRSPSVATVASDGRISAKSPGDAWVVLASATSADSVFVIVPKSATSPVFRANNTTWVATAGDTTFATIVFDPRGTAVGAASLSVGIQVNPSVWTTIIPILGAGPPAMVLSNTTGDILRIAFGTATGVTAPVTVLTLKLVGPAGRSGWLTLLALDISAPDGSSLTAQTTSTRFPIVIK